MADTTQEKQTINSVLKESLGSLQTLAVPDAADSAEQSEKTILQSSIIKWLLFHWLEKTMRLTL